MSLPDVDTETVWIRNTCKFLGLINPFLTGTYGSQGSRTEPTKTLMIPERWPGRYTLDIEDHIPNKNKSGFTALGAFFYDIPISRYLDRAGLLENIRTVLQ